ncbi:MAG: ribose-5-phosphate isomerase RpiA [Alphaproteobacteria bacterium]|nr:ribose-5-phosphate isomerase RpiA [Alphaproteobacteria bacterium]
MQNDEKRIAGEAAVELVRDGMTLGLGTGSTVAFFLKALGEKVRLGMKVRGVPTSERTAHLCHQLGIELLDFASVDRLDLNVDGADEVDHDFRMIKGGGGALLREKLVALASRRNVIIADSSKAVERLGAFPLPVEIVRFGHHQIKRRIEEMGVRSTLRITGDDPYITDNGHYILDCQTGPIPDPAALEAWLKSVTGVVDTGLFLCHCHTLIIGKGDEAIRRNKQD